MLRDRAKLVQSLIQGFDIIASVLIFRIAVALPGLRTGPVASDTDLVALLIPGLVTCTAWPLVLEQLELYGSQRRQSLLRVLTGLLAAGALTTAAIATATLLVAPPVTVVFPIFVGCAQCAVLASVRIFAHALLRSHRADFGTLRGRR